MTEIIINFFKNLIGNDYLIILFISMIPIIELRGAIPVGVAMGIPLWLSCVLAWVGSTLVCPILLLILRPILNWMKKCKLFKSLAEGVESIFQGKADKVASKSENFDTSEIERRKLLGVFAFVAIPIPMTGVWTGTAIAVFMNLKFWKSFAVVAVGNLIAGTIIGLLTHFFSDYLNTIIMVFLGIVIAVLIAFIIKLILKIKKNKINSTNESANQDNDKID